MTKDAKTDLFRCPYCGDEPSLLQVHQGYRVQCTWPLCKVNPETKEYRNPDIAIGEWNIRFWKKDL